LRKGIETPDFFLVGAPKCGTTALDSYLDAHPEIFMALQKESHHFATDLTDERDKYRSREAYLELFRGAEGARRVGESSVFYLYSRAAAEAIKALRSDARIIVMLRNPLTMIPSLHSENLFSGYEVEKDLAHALDAEDSRLAIMSKQRELRIPERLLYRRIADYAPQLARFFGAFGRERVKVVLYEDFAANVAQVYRDVLQFLGVDTEFETAFPIINANKVPRTSLLATLLWRPPRILQRAWRGLGLPSSLQRGLRKRLVRLNARKTPRARLSAALESRIREEMAPPVARLEQLLGRNLSVWPEFSRAAMSAEGAP